MWGGGSGSGSYANDWGGRYDNYQVLINGQTFSVTQNLRNAHQFLGRRTAGQGRRFWTDAICINQTDVNEKSSQIRMMSHIYFRAQTVLVWLGRFSAEAPHTTTVLLIVLLHVEVLVSF